MRRIMTLIVLLTLGGCASRPKSQPIANEGRKKPMVKAEYLKAFDTRRVRNPDFVKSYYIGRRPSRNRHVDARDLLLSRARGLVPVNSSSTGSSGRRGAPVGASLMVASGRPADGRGEATASAGLPPPIFPPGLRATLSATVAATAAVADERAEAATCHKREYM